jgi:hypothetical protein
MWRSASVEAATWCSNGIAESPWKIVIRFAFWTKRSPAVPTTDALRPQRAGEGATPSGVLPRQAEQPQPDLTPAVPAGILSPDTARAAATAMPLWLIIATAMLVILIPAGLALILRNRAQEPTGEA